MAAEKDSQRKMAVIMSSSPQSPESPSWRKATTNNANDESETKHFRFLDLPGELRDNVYEKILEDGCSWLSRNYANQNPIVESALVRTCRQVRLEMLNFALRHAPIIQTTVRNYNFGHVIAFLNRLSAARPFKAGKALHQRSNSAQRVFRIELQFDGCAVLRNCMGNAQWILENEKGAEHTRLYKQLARWLDRFEETWTESATIDFKYRLHGSHGDRIYGRWWPLYKDIDLKTRSGRRLGEAKRILRAVLKLTIGGFSNVRELVYGLDQELVVEDDESDGEEW